MRIPVKKIFSRLLIIIITFTILFLCGEIIFRAFFPEYKNQTTTIDSYRGKKMYFSSFNNMFQTRTRTKNTGFNFTPGERIVLLIGDSVSNGIGNAYEDIYWSYWNRMLRLKGDKTKIITMADMGNNFVNISEKLAKALAFFKNKDIKITGFIYQFNFNDLIQYTRQNIKSYKHLETSSKLLSKIIIATSRFNARYIYRSVMLRVILNKLTRFFYDNSNTPCEKLGLDALGGYTYTFGAKNSEEASRKIWGIFEDYIFKIKNQLGEIPFVILIAPIAELIEPEMNIHSLSRPKRMDCATINPVSRLETICKKSGIYLVNPVEYMKMNFELYIEGGNPVRFYLLNDDNHFNDIGSKYFAEYSYIKIFEEGIIPKSAFEK